MKNPLIQLNILVILFISTFAVVSAQIKPKVDERIELTSIVARLAGYEEYSQNIFRSYTSEVDRYFAKFKNHPAIEFAKELRQKSGIGFDAVPTFATRLSSAPSLKPRVDFAKSELDKRWKRADAEKFANLLKQFYLDTNCKKFFQKHAQMYRIAEKRFARLLKKVNFAWYREFYGQQAAGNFNLVVSLLNGGSNYNSTVVLPDGKEDLFAILGTWAIDKDGLPIYNDEVLPTIIHEFGHSFNNRLILSEAKNLESSGAIIFPQVKDQMSFQGYAAPLTMFIESLLRACVIKYLEKNPLPNITAQQVIVIEEQIGFLWTGRLVKLLDEYEKARRKYPNLSSFMPKIVEFFNETSTKLSEIKSESLAKRPKIVLLTPFSNESVGVDENTQEIRITFDREMQDKTGFNLIDAKNPFISEPFFEKDKRTLVGKVKLEANNEYGVLLPMMRFLSVDGYPLRNDFQLYFTTKGFVIPTNYGYQIENGIVIFSFKKPLNLTDEIKNVSVAGEFNNWNPAAQGFKLTKTGENIYQIKIKAETLGKSGERKMFKFVVNENIWIEPPLKAENVVKDGQNRNLFLELK